MPYVLVEDVKPVTTAICFVAAVITTVADGKATAGWACLWQMLMSCGRWKNTWMISWFLNICIHLFANTYCVLFIRNTKQVHKRLVGKLI